MLKLKRMKVIISTGGTGGHIFPAIAVADEIRRRIPESEILFVGAKGKMEMEKVPRSGYEIIGLPVRGFVRKLSLNSLKTVGQFMQSILKARTILRRFKPDMIMGFGAFASGPILLSSYFSKTPRFIHEQNAFPGFVNRSMASSVQKIFVAYQNMDRFFPKGKIVQVGNPVRKEAETFDKEAARRHFGVDANKKIVLITGGSLGAKTLNESILNKLDQIAGHMDIHWILQCGQRYFDELKANKDEWPENLTVLPFIDKMSWAMQLADVVCARAGALTVSELAYYGKATVLIPSPNVAEDHQTKNAMALKQEQACLLIKDEDAKTELTDQVIKVLKKEETLNELGENIKRFSSQDAQKLIVDELIKTLGYES